MPNDWRETRHTRAHTRSRHERRIANRLTPVENGNSPAEPQVTDDQIDAAWHELQKYWLRTVPGYRELLKDRISKAIQDDMIPERACVGCGIDYGHDPHAYTDGCETCWNRKRGKRRREVDKLGPEIDPCG